jgi:hypothetical protein
MQTIKIADYMRGYREKNKKYLNELKQSRLNEIKQIVYEKFGSACQSCGRSEIENLTMHHINGHQDEKKHGGLRITGKKLWRLVYMEGWPKDKFEMLCWNCHLGIRHNRKSKPRKKKKCPHCGGLI